MTKKKIFNIKNKKFILAIYGEAGVILLAKLFEFNINLENILILTHNIKANQRLISLLKIYNLKFVFDKKKIKHTKKIFTNFKPNYFLSFYFRNKINEELYNLKNCYSINLHPSLLPRYAGCFSNCMNLLNKEKYTGITFHYLTNKFDSGNIVLQKKIKISNYDTSFSLHYKLINLACNNLFSLFKKLYLDSPKGKEQNLKKRTYFYRKLPYSGRISKNWSVSKKRLFIRAMYFPPFDFRSIKHKN